MNAEPELEPMDADKARFPMCITWTPLPLISWIIPCIGHVGIGHSNGMIHDFAGPYYVSVDDFAFGKATKYVMLHVEDVARYNQCLEKADKTYRKREHNLCCDNCHSHVAKALSNYEYMGKRNWNMVDIWWMCIAQSKYVSWGALLKTYIGWIIVILITVTLVLISKTAK